MNYLSEKYPFLESLWFCTVHATERLLKKSCSTWLLHLFLIHHLITFYEIFEFPVEARTIVTSFQLHFASEVIINGDILIPFIFYTTALNYNYKCLFKIPRFIFLFSWTLVSSSLYVFGEWMMLSATIPGTAEPTQWLSSSGTQEKEPLKNSAQSLLAGAHMHLWRD